VPSIVLAFVPVGVVCERGFLKVVDLFLCLVVACIPYKKKKVERLKTK
jgi:hypothetical protein